jgi:ABC-type dipeptide/oligopeptide/nickel transport system permease component
MIIADIFAGSIIMEQVFSIPGMGQLLISSISARDFPLVQTLVLYIAVVVVLANTLVDVAIKLIDPRVRIG